MLVHLRSTPPMTLDDHVVSSAPRPQSFQRAEVAEQADATVSKTVEGNLIRVRVPASAPQSEHEYGPVAALSYPEPLSMW